MRARLNLIAVAVIGLMACEHSSCWRELSSGRRKPEQGEVVGGAWRLTPESVAMLKAAGRAESEAQVEFIRFGSQGRCFSELVMTTCGREPYVQTRGLECSWVIGSGQLDRRVLEVTFGTGERAVGTRYEMRDRGTLVLWQYLCPAESGKVLELIRSAE